MFDDVFFHPVGRNRCLDRQRDPNMASESRRIEGDPGVGVEEESGAFVQPVPVMAENPDDVSCCHKAARK